MKQQPVSYGGQAVIEGVMMQGGGGYAIACRKEDGSIIYKNGANKKPEERPKIWRLPLFRGVYSFASSMKMGFSCLSWSAMQAGEEEEALTWKEVAFAVVSALVLVILIFVVVPVLIDVYKRQGNSLSC